MQRFDSIPLAIGLVCCGMAGAHGQRQYPDMDRFADKVVQQLRDLSCRDIAALLIHRPVREPNEQELIRTLYEDAQIRQAFIDRVAAPLTQKLFECLMVPDDWQ